jgi:hypothetical protein
MTDYTSAEFWAGAPEGATHWEPGSFKFSAGWMRLKDGWWSYWSDSQKRWLSGAPSCNVSVSRADTFISRPTTQSDAWNGDGLPPVGTVCDVEYDTGRELWHEAEIIYHKSDDPRFCAARLRITHPDKLVWASQFRPIHTPEQIAAAEREAYIKRMRECVNDFERDRDNDFGRLYDAGLRFKDDYK